MFKKHHIGNTSYKRDELLVDEEKLIEEFKNILDKLSWGCDNMVELKSKCNHCICNAGPYKDKKMLCTKKYYERL